MLTSEQARAFYDRLGKRQDSQAFYEDPATDALVFEANFADAREVFEFGCGTGKFAETLLEHQLHLSAHYTAVDLSPVMVSLAQQRLSAFADRISITQTDGDPLIDAKEGSMDRIVSNYVLDLLRPDDIGVFVDECRRVLKADGLLCLVSLTFGTTLVSRILILIWSMIHRLNPSLVGGCHPVDLTSYIPTQQWEILHTHTVVAWGVPSQVLVARPRRHRAAVKSEEAA